MRARMKMMMMVMLVVVAAVCASDAQQQQQQQQQQVWPDTIRFSTKAQDLCTMGVSAAGNLTRLRVSCRPPGQPAGRSYYCDFQGQPTLCRAYHRNPRHYFTQMMWELRKLRNACQGARIYRPHMCRKFSDEAHMTFLTSWPKPPKAGPEPRKPAQTKPTVAHRPGKPQPPPARPPPGRRSTPRPARTTGRPTQEPASTASRLATEHCWKSFHGICSYILGWIHG